MSKHLQQTFFQWLGEREKGAQTVQAEKALYQWLGEPGQEKPQGKRRPQAVAVPGVIDTQVELFASKMLIIRIRMTRLSEP